MDNARFYGADGVYTECLHHASDKKREIDSVVVSFRVRRKESEELKRLAMKEGKTLSIYIADAIQNHLKRLDRRAMYEEERRRKQDKVIELSQKATVPPSSPASVFVTSKQDKKIQADWELCACGSGLKYYKCGKRGKCWAESHDVG